MLIVIQTNCVSVMDRETSGKTDSDRICSDLISRDEFEKSYDYSLLIENRYCTLSSLRSDHKAPRRCAIIHSFIVLRTFLERFTSTCNDCNGVRMTFARREGGPRGRGFQAYTSSLPLSAPSPNIS